MKKVLIVYWSGTGNTEAMAESVVRGVKEAGAEADLRQAAKASAEDVAAADALAFGCSAMGDEVLEESEMEPFIASLGSKDLEGKSLGLFGSYDWGDGQWMRDWADRMKGLGAQINGEAVITQLEPDEAALSKCYDLGKRLAE
ncbi:flavodoxin [Breznakiella homolactica]|uniref:Flavodoxin n=1 Tax=Breznakiella homolactica TaxID=2798577 RepID=A0A7T7XPZ5_9SPIR|nr:flavodoxin [Breznakiella homolactica]QQO10343.1 flavodoxin [Breznakiella homolactica]